MVGSATSAVLLSRSEMERGAAPDAWAAEAFSSFRATLESRTEKFPCVFGVKGLREDSLRFAFVPEEQPGPAAATLAPALRRFARESRRFGRYTSLVAFFRLPVGLSIDAYETFFWQALEELRGHDTQPWPSSIPTDAEDPRWEFCFEGTPMFVVCGTPAHDRRRSRRTSTFVITFQPRWVFVGLEEDARSGRQARRVIRARLHAFDTVDAFPGLGSYGVPGNREWIQYFLPEDNEVPPGRCPMSETLEVSR